MGKSIKKKNGLMYMTFVNVMHWPFRVLKLTDQNAKRTDIKCLVLLWFIIVGSRSIVNEGNNRKIFLS